MSERIKGLAEQADGVVINKMMTGARQYTFLEEDLEKFAELIVRECAGIFEGIYTDQQRPERIDIRIKKHFGVEE